MEVYKKVRAYIEENGYKQLAVAQKAGISKVTFNAMMNGKRTMYADDLRAICLALNVSPEVFIEVPKKLLKPKGVIFLKNIDKVANAVLLMDEQLREELLIKDGAVQAKKLWENTYIKKQIDKRENGGTFTISDHICAMVYSMLTSGASWSRVEPSLDIETGRIQLIDEIFCQYDVDTLLNTDPMILVDKVKAQTLGTQYIKNQMVALVGTNIGKMQSLEKEYGSIDNFYQKFIDTDPTLKTLVKVLSAEGKPHKYAQMGEALTAEYLKNVGYDIAKPDRHIRRILGSKALGCSDSEIAPIYEAFDIVADIAKATGKRIAEVDYILWSYCANGYGEVCTVNKPKCNICVVEHCKNKSK